MDQEIIEIKDALKQNTPSESFKNLRTNLLYTDDLKVIALSSVSPDEGKTTVAYNLAYSFAQMGKNVALVDGDLRKSSLYDLLTVSRKTAGLTEVLTKQTRNYVRATNIPNLYLVFSGKRPPNPSELLTSPSFDHVVEDLRQVFDYVIIDTPPVASTMDAKIIGKKCDGVVLVVRNDYTSKKTLKRAKIEFERNGVRLVGAVLNRVKKSNSSYYGYSYGYDKYY